MPSMPDWIEQALSLLAHDEPAVLVTVARVQGSTPREPGARMLVAATRQWQTIGGGHLEWRALAIARLMIQNKARLRQIERMALGPSLGQCCGGVATLAFELLTPADIGWLETLAARWQRQQASVRTVVFPVDASASAALPAVTLSEAGGSGAPDEACTLWQADGQRGLTEFIAPPSFNIVLFGAGHVGQALVRILGSLPCTVTWVDERDTQFPDDIPSNVAIEDTDVPEVVIEQAPPDSYFVVMTHNHSLDQHLCQHIFQRIDYAWFGLIGSLTKRHKFEHRLRARGVSAERFEQMVCPIGVPGITGKEPAVIAVAVAAQLLAVHEARKKGTRPAAAAPLAAMTAR